MRVRLPTPDKLEDEELKLYLRHLVQAIERALERLPELPLSRDRIKVSNLTAQYTLDSSSATLGDVRSVLGTILRQLQDSGSIS